MRGKNVVLLVMGSWIITSLYTLQMSKSGRPVQYRETNDYLLNTSGCLIPNYAKTLKFMEAHDKKLTCGHRAVFVNRYDSNIKFQINTTLMKKHYKGSQGYQCCYRFVSRSTMDGKEDADVTYTNCTYFKTGTTVELKEEVVVVSCATVPNKKNKGRITFYEDAYIILKRMKEDTSGDSVGQQNWNVLILGMDTMSRARFLNSMPKTASYFNHHGWLDYRGHQKVGFNTFPNLMAFLTGRNMSTIYSKCSKRMDHCNEEMIWSKFQNSGYVTAYGEDYLNLPDTFFRYHGFKTPPTNHYMRPFFLTGETQKGNLVCTKQMPSAIHALHYALDFVDSYKNNKFFGMFWLNSYSHNLNNLPAALDNDLVDFWNKLNNTGALSNTFVFFLSDHGIRFGKMRETVESYYEERLPMFYMWAPLDFQEAHSQYYYNLQSNQKRLTTPYEMYVTLRNILQLSSKSPMDGGCEACPQCTGLFYEIMETQNCASAGVPEKWCSCHNLISISEKEYGAAHSIQLAVSLIQNISKSRMTTKCMKCSTLKLKTVLRIHMHVDNVNNKTTYVTAFVMTPGSIGFEASVEKGRNGFHIIGQTRTISEYNSRGSCVIEPYDREFCFCEKERKCT